jgi:2-phosphosulfolactate phosphatase
MRDKKVRKVEVFLSPLQIDELYLRGKNVVVVDVLRASTTIAMALSNGAKEIIPVATIESAVKVSGSLFGDVTLRGGERNGKIIKGFNLGNSPNEYAQETVKNKSIIYTTTNGSAALVKARYAKVALVAGFVNISRVVAFLKTLKEDFIVVCAGTGNDFSFEDSVCAGMIVARYQKGVRGMSMNDSARACVFLHEKYGKNILGMLEETDHGKFLVDIGFRSDLRVCGDVDSLPVLPVMSGNVIKLLKGETQEVAD